MARFRKHPELSERVAVRMTLALRSALELEAWECQQTLDEYVRGLLERRGKWARMVGRAGGYDIGPGREESLGVALQRSGESRFEEASRYAGSPPPGALPSGVIRHEAGCATWRLSGVCDCIPTRAR